MAMEGQVPDDAVLSVSTASSAVDGTPVADQPQLLRMLGDSVQLMSSIVAGDHVRCGTAQAQLQSALDSLKQQLQEHDPQPQSVKQDCSDLTHLDGGDDVQAQLIDQKAVSTDVLVAKSRESDDATPVKPDQGVSCDIYPQQRELADSGRCSSDEQQEEVIEPTHVEPSVVHTKDVMSAEPSAYASKSVTPTSGTAGAESAFSAASGTGVPPLPPRCPAVVAAQEQATALAGALSAVAAAAASQQIDTDTASGIAAALVRTASRARLTSDDDTTVSPAVPVMAAAEQPPLHAQQKVQQQLEAVAATLLQEQAASGDNEQYEAVVAQGAGADETAATLPVEQQAFAETLQAIAAEQLAAVPSGSNAVAAVTAAAAAIVAADKAAAVPASISSQANSVTSSAAPTPTALSSVAASEQPEGASQAVKAALANLHTGLPSSSFKASTSSNQRAAKSTGFRLAAGVGSSTIGQVLLQALQERLSLPVPSGQQVMRGGGSGTAAELLKDAGFPTLQPIRTTSVVSDGSAASSSQPGTPNSLAAAGNAAAAAAINGAKSKTKSKSSETPTAVSMSGEDVVLADLLLSSAQAAIGDVGAVLTELLGFSAADQADVMAALSDSGNNPAQVIACYLHNMRVVNMDATEAAAEGDSAGAKQAAVLKALVESLSSGLVEKYCSIVAEPEAEVGEGVDAASSEAVEQPLPPVPPMPQQQHQVTALQSAASSVQPTAGTAAAPPLTQAQMSSLLASTQAQTGAAPAAPSATAPAAAPTPSAAAIAASLAAIPAQQQASIVALLQQLVQGSSAPAGAAPPIPPAPAPTAGLDSLLSAAVAMLAAQQQQAQQQQQQQQAAMQVAIQSAFQQVQQQQLVQHAAAAQQAAVAQQQAVAAAVAAAGLAPAAPQLDMQSLQLLASLQQQQAGGTALDGLGQHVPTSGSLLLPPSGLGPSGAGGSALNAATVAALGGASVPALASGMVGMPALLPSQLQSSSVAMSIAANAGHMSLPVVCHGLAPGAPAANMMQPTAAGMPPNPHQHSLQGQVALAGYGDGASAAWGLTAGSELVSKGSYAALSTMGSMTAGSASSSSMSTGHMATAAGAQPPSSGAQAPPSGPPSDGSYTASHPAGSYNLARQASGAIAVPAVAAAVAAAAQHNQGTPPTAGSGVVSSVVSSMYLDSGASAYNTAAAPDAAGHNAAALAHLHGLDAATAAAAAAAAAAQVNQAQQQQLQQHLQQAQQQHQQAAAVAAAAAAAAVQQQQVQQQLAGDMFYGYQHNAVVCNNGPGMSGVVGLAPTFSNDAGMDWQVWQQQQQQAQQLQQQHTQLQQPQQQQQQQQ